MKFQRKHWLSLGISILVAILVYGCDTYTRINEFFDEEINDFCYFLRNPNQPGINITEGITRYTPNPHVSENILMLNIDNETLDYFKDRGQCCPIPWSAYATATKAISDLGAKVIYYGLPLFDQNPEEMLLTESFVKTRNVVMSYLLDNKNRKSMTNDAVNMNLINTHRWPAGRDVKDRPYCNGTITPSNKYLMKSAAATGFDDIAFMEDNDSKIKKIPLIFLNDNYYYPGTTLSMVMLYYGITDEDVEIRQGLYIKLKNIQSSMMAIPNEKNEIIIPIDRFGNMRINYAGSAGSFQEYPFSLFHHKSYGKSNNHSMEDKIVIIGVNRTERVPMRILPTPSDSMIVNEIRAHAINTIIQQYFIHEPGTAAKTIIFFLTAILLGLIIPRMHWIVSTILSLIVMETGLIIVGYLAFELYSIMLPLAMFGQLF